VRTEAPAAGDVERLSRPVDRGATLALSLATLAFALCFAVWGMLAPLAPTFRELYRLSATEVGLLVAVPVVLGALGRIPLGLLTDRFGGRVIFTALMAGTVLPLLAVSLVDSYGSLLGVSLLLGMSGASFAVGVPFVAAWYPPERRGFALGVYGMGNIGTAIAALVGPRVAAAAGWPSAFWMWIPLLLAMALVFWSLARDAPGFQPVSTPVAQRFAIFRREPLTWVLALFYFVTFGGFVAIGAYLPAFLVSEYGLELADAAGRASGFILLATLARPLGGYLGDRWGGAPILNMAFVIVAIFAVVLAFRPQMIPSTIAFLGTAFVLGLGNGAVFKLVVDYFPRESGVITGLVGAAGGLGGFFPPLLMGLVRDITGSYAIAWMLLSEFALLCLLVNVLVVQQRARMLMPHDVRTHDARG
jgi:MFS transporter, NNP family, nitrate/nitrite transporter